MIISRYLTKEILHTLLAVTFILLLLFLSNQLVRYLGYAASGKIPLAILLQLMGLEVPYLLVLLLPLGLYLGTISAYARLYADSEMRVMQACGLSIGRLLLITSFLAVIVTIIVTGLTLWAGPLLAVEKDKLLSKRLAADNILETLIPGRFQSISNGQRVVYVEKISRNHKEADNIFIAEQKASDNDEDNTAWAVMSAAHGYQMHGPLPHDRFVVAENGYRYVGTPGQNNYQIIHFKKYAVRVPQPEIPKSHAFEILPTQFLWQHYHVPGNAAELQWRFSMPISAFLLAMLAVPLSKIQPRQSRYAPLFPAILIYIIYLDLLFVARNWIGQKTLSVGLGMWWVHGLILALAIVLILLQTKPFSLRSFFTRKGR